MGRRIVWLALALSAAPAAAQFSNLVTNHDGSMVLFSAELRLRGTDQVPWAKLFIADEGGVRLFEQRLEPLRPANFLFGGPPSQLVQADMGSDGGVRSVTAFNGCSVGYGCLFQERYFSEVRREQAEPVQVRGIARLDSGGRFAVGYDWKAIVVDLQTRNVIEIAETVGGYPSSGARIITREGTAFFVAASSEGGDTGTVLAVDTRGTVRRIQTYVRPRTVSVDDAGTLLAYQTADGVPAIRLFDLTTGLDRELVAAREGAVQPVLTHDGRAVLFLSSANFAGTNGNGRVQAWVIKTDTDELRQVTNDPAGISEAAVSGNGQVVWAVSYAGRLLRIGVDSGVTRDLTGRTTVVDTVLGSEHELRGGRRASGSMTVITGRGLAEGTSEMDHDVQVIIDDRSVPLSSVEPTKIRFQIPWDIVGVQTIRVTTGESLFEPHASAATTVSAIEPLVLSAAHGDFRGLVTEDDPAAQGEVLHFYVTGLGPVTPAVGTGQPGPADPPARTITNVEWTWWTSRAGTSPAQVLFSGLAPGFIGIYQLSVRVPSSLDGPLLRLESTRGGFIDLPVRPR